jgi:hypothetical protein
VLKNKKYTIFKITKNIKGVFIMRKRIFSISQYEFNPTTGEDLHFNEENIKNCVAHKTIKEYAYIKHDKDVCTKEDEVNGHKIGDVKPTHWHLIIKCDRAVELETIAKWLGIPPQYVEVPGGVGAFLDCVKYLTHEDEKQQKLGKYFYSDDEVIANFDFREALAKRDEQRLRYNGHDLSVKDQMRYDVHYNGKTLRECQIEDPINFNRDVFTLRKYRGEYLTYIAQMPNYRINFYIDGKGGIGKGTCSKLLAKVLFPNIENPYFEVGGSGVPFQTYDGEPVLIWNDRRASSFIGDFGRDETFDMFDPIPSPAAHDVKYGQTRLINPINIINGIESYEDFLNGLAGEYTDKQGTFHESEDKGQSYRRFPIIICLREEQFDVLFNKGVMENTREYEQYLGYKNLMGNFAKVAQRFDGQAKEKIAINMLSTCIEGVERFKQNMTQKITDENDIPEEFLNYGKVELDLTRYDLLPF